MRNSIVRKTHISTTPTPEARDDKKEPSLLTSQTSQHDWPEAKFYPAPRCPCPLASQLVFSCICRVLVHFCDVRLQRTKERAERETGLLLVECCQKATTDFFLLVFCLFEVGKVGKCGVDWGIQTGACTEGGGTG